MYDGFAETSAGYKYGLYSARFKSCEVIANVKGLTKGLKRGITRQCMVISEAMLHRFSLILHHKMRNSFESKSCYWTNSKQLFLEVAAPSPTVDMEW